MAKYFIRYEGHDVDGNHIERSAIMNIDSFESVQDVMNVVQSDPELTSNGYTVSYILSMQPV